MKVQTFCLSDVYIKSGSFRTRLHKRVTVSSSFSCRRCELHPKMRQRQRILNTVGNVFNDIFRHILSSFEMFFFKKVIKLLASQTGMIMLIEVFADALISPLSGYLGDRINLPFLARKIGAWTTWHLLATNLTAISVPPLFNYCFLSDITD